jgi:hypothetical protein
MAVKFEGTSDFTKVVKDLEKLQQQYINLQQRMAGVTKESASQGGRFKAVFEGGIGQLKSMVGGYASLQGAIALVNQGLAEQKRISQEINRVQMSAADAQAEVVKNLGNVSTEHATQFLKDVEKISKQSGAPSVVPVYQAAANTLSAVGDQELTKTILRTTLPLFKSKPEELATYAGAIGDLAKISGSTTQDQIEQITSLVISSQKYSRGATLASFENVAPAIAAVAAVDTGKDRVRAINEGLALSSAISTAIADPDMALTKTATAEVATALESLLPEKTTLDAAGNIKRRGTGMKTAAERLAAVQASPELQRRFFETGEGHQMASFRGPIAPVIKQLVSDPNSPIVKDFAAAMAGISPDVSGFRQMRQNLVTATPELQTAEYQRRSLSKIESTQLGSTTLGRMAAAKEIVGKALDVTSRGIFDQAVKRPLMFASLEADIQKGIDPLQAAETILRSRRSDVVGGRAGLELTAANFEGREVDEAKIESLRGTMSDRDRESNDLLRELIEEVRRLREGGTPGAGATAARDLTLQREGR